MKETWNDRTEIRCNLPERPQDRVAQLLEERNALMAKMHEIDEQMSAIMALCEKWQEMTRSMR